MDNQDDLEDVIDQLEPLLVRLARLLLGLGLLSAPLPGNLGGPIASASGNPNLETRLCCQLGGYNISVLSAFICVPADNNH